LNEKRGMSDSCKLTSKKDSKFPVFFIVIRGDDLILPLMLLGGLRNLTFFAIMDKVK
jgi:hypothetical protein